MSSGEKDERVIEVCTPIGVQPGTKLLQLRYLPQQQSWKLWLHHDLAMQYGSFLVLSPSGGITRITLRPDGTEEIHVVK
jgi:hypothetical protein